MAETEADRQLQEAARTSPQLAAVLAGVHRDPAPRYRRLAVLVGGGAIGIGLAWLVAWSLASRRPEARPSEPAAEVDRSTYLAPIKAQAAGPGEGVAPFAGFAVSVDTDPPGALVSIGKVVRGEAPVLAQVECRGGEAIEVRAEKDGFAPTRRQVSCRADALVKLIVHLDKR